MSSVQVLITTMHAVDFSKIKEMNLQTDAVIANQADRYDYAETEETFGLVQMITTTTRGLSVNRNIAITQLDKKAKYILFADDDLRFIDGYESVICKEFAEHPESDGIFYALNCISGRKLTRGNSGEFKRATRMNTTSTGVCAFAIKTEKLLMNNLHFNQCFGAGTEIFCGEDTIFTQDMLKKRLRLFFSPTVIADIDQSTSTWNEGATPRRYQSAGMVLAAVYPKLSCLLAIRSAYKMSRRNKEFGFMQICRFYFEGISKLHGK